MIKETFGGWVGRTVGGKFETGITQQTEAMWSHYMHGNINKAVPRTTPFGAEGHEIL